MRHEKGICFISDERFVPRHMCKSSQTFLVELVELNHDGGEHEIDNIKLSIHAIMEENGSRPMKIGVWV